MFLIFTYVMSRVTHSEPGLPIYVYSPKMLEFWMHLEGRNFAKIVCLGGWFLKSCAIYIWRQRGRVVRAPDLKSRVQFPFWLLADVFPVSSEFNFSAMLLNSQLVFLPPVGILNLVIFIWIFIYHWLFHSSWKAPMGSGQLRIRIHNQGLFWGII